MRRDEDRDLHDHPWNARTIILRGEYVEARIAGETSKHSLVDCQTGEAHTLIRRRSGDTARLNHGEYHRIASVSTDGVITMFITSKWRGDWGFLVNGVKVPWRTYTGTDN